MDRVPTETQYALQIPESESTDDMTQYSWSVYVSFTVNIALLSYTQYIEK